MASAIHAVSIGSSSDVSPILPQLSTWTQRFSSLPHWFESSLGQFPAHPWCLNTVYCVEALIIGILSANHHTTFMNQETVKTTHIYLNKNKYLFWDDFYHIVKLWRKKIKSSAGSSKMFWRKTQGAEGSRMGPYSPALLVSRAASLFLYFFLLEEWEWRERKRRRRYYKMRV